jgi:hypothetical protein
MEDHRFRPNISTIPIIIMLKDKESPIRKMITTTKLDWFENAIATAFAMVTLALQNVRYFALKVISFENIVDYANSHFRKRIRLEF